MSPADGPAVDTDVPPPAAGATPADAQILSGIAERVRKGECILFLGAGVHSPPPAASSFVYAEADRPPSGGALSERLAGQTSFAHDFPRDSVRNLARVALHYEQTLSRHRLVNEISGAVQDGKQPSPALRALAELPWALVVTTNYDQLFERALRAVGKDPVVSVYDPDDNAETRDIGGRPKPERPFILKIHGDIGSPASLVVTDEDYIQFVLRMSDKDVFNPVPLGLKYHFKIWPTLFVGYSLMDYNLRLLFKTLRWKMDRAEIPDTYSIDPYPDGLIVRVLWDQYRYVKFIAQDVWTFVPELYRAVMGKEMAR
ncbi:MAG: SIR2 family protein [Gemmatimonadaceae bacterium]